MGAFGGFLGGLNGGVQNQLNKNQQQNGGLGLGLQSLGNQQQGQTNQQPAAISSQWSILPIIKNAMGGSQPAAAPATPQVSQNGNPLPPGLHARPTPPSAGQTPGQTPMGTAPQATGQVPAQITPGTAPQINTQQHQSGFHGIIPMAMGYYQNHQAGVRDASAQQHINSLQDPNITPEQRQYHQSSLQQIYQGQPQVLQQMGLQPQQSGYSVPNVVAPGGTQ